MAVIDTAPASNSPYPTAVAIAQMRLPMNAKAITKSDADTFSNPVAVFVGGAGTVTVTPAGAQSDVQFTVPAGGMVPVLVTAVKSTGTAATAMVAVY